MQSQETFTIGFEDFLKLDIRIGTIVEAKINEKARVPAFVIKIDFGNGNYKVSSAQITQHYTVDSLIGRQVAAVCNFAPKLVAGIKSEVLVLGAMSAQGTILLEPTMHAPNGSKIG